MRAAKGPNDTPKCERARIVPSTPGQDRPPDKIAARRVIQLREALNAMSEAVVAYKGMPLVRERLCAELDRMLV